ncbi:hypothetical protein ACTD5D_40205 [Nocardia takedensis]|uniref:hypothetical protein n=1 Tax=Nocardia takedensis TaxID=259390 RepID=UPI003F7671A5
MPLREAQVDVASLPSAAELIAHFDRLGHPVRPPAGDRFMSAAWGLAVTHCLLDGDEVNLRRYVGEIDASVTELVGEPTARVGECVSVLAGVWSLRRHVVVADQFGRAATVAAAARDYDTVVDALADRPRR